ncbi:MAG TPA: ATP-binding protein, partial [Candidatus Acidoferrales bacterium]
QPVAARMIRALPSGVEIWSAGSNFYLGARAPLAEGGQFVAARRMPDNFLARYSEIEVQILSYQQQRQEYRFFRTGMQIALALFTVMLLFSTTWFALFLSKQVTVPIEALAEGTREVSHGNFDYRVDVQAQDELGTLVESFNQMTAQLGESRRQIDEFTRSLQVAVQELERQKRVIEAVVENIPTGVVSLDSAGNITRVNPAFMKMLGEHARQARILPELLGEEAVRGVQSLMRKSLRMGTASKELEIALPGRVLHAAVTVTSLGPRRANPGFIVVVDDLTELLRAQKSAAWQEVAQRIAHEIKNPLTPIQLSSQRLLRHLTRTQDSGADGEELRQLTAECAALIEREVSTLKSLVDEFSQFARFPTARPVPSSVNAIVGEALEVFHGRLEGVAMRTRLADQLPQVKADRELLRRVVINLIDNAAEAIEGTTLREIEVATQLDPEGEAVEIIVADSGHGISPEDKNHLFLPHFSTRDRGTGLGLAIANRIVAEHNGTLRVEDNLPVGARFVIRLPAVEVVVAEAVPPAT